MLFKLTATTLEGKNIRAFIKARSFKNINTKVDFINDAITNILSSSDFINEITITAWPSDYEDIFIKVAGNAISGQVVIGNCKLVDLK